MELRIEGIFKFTTSFVWFKVYGVSFVHHFFATRFIDTILKFKISKLKIKGKSFNFWLFLVVIKVITTLFVMQKLVW